MRITISPGVPLIVGDFNIHVDIPSNVNTVRFLSLLEVANLTQHVTSATHRGGHTLDLVVSRKVGLEVSKVSANMSVPSDHWAVIFHLAVSKPPKPTKRVIIRKWRSIDIEALSADIGSSVLMRDPPSTPSEAVCLYNKVMSQLLDHHAPSREMEIVVRHKSPWFNSDLRAAKRERRKWERQYKKTGLTIHYDIYKQKRNEAHRLRENAKKEYYTQRIADSGDQKDLFRVLDTLMGERKNQVFPSLDTGTKLADQFADFFTNKIENIHKTIASMDHTDITLDASFDIVTSLCTFTPVSHSEVLKLLSSCKAKSCGLDPIPTWLVKECKDSLVPIMANIINASLSSGVFPSECKEAIVAPILKKASLDPGS